MCPEDVGVLMKAGRRGKSISVGAEAIRSLQKLTRRNAASVIFMRFKGLNLGL
jgi:hypothetical protein